ncbi:universal stress protein [Pseudarthrobacter sp. NPDC092439]|uniref:universal stress protein n=1 Tax=unclassified Pseudarthrobacter TaxID=2647000 RepID=UPI00382BE590
MAARKPIAVGTNDTPQSHAAVSWAARRAHRDRLPLVILHVVDERWLSEPYPWRSVLQESGERILEAAAARARAFPSLEVSTAVLAGGVGRSLANYSDRVSMLVVGSGSGHLGGVLADRALQVASSADVPVAVVGTQATEGRPGVVVGVDGSEEAVRAVAFAAAEADREGDELTVVYAYSPPDRLPDAGFTPELVAELMEKEERIVLSETVAGLMADYPDLVVHQRLEPGRDPAQALVQAAEGARLLVVGNRGRGGISRLVLGSTAHGVLKRLPCPTIITRIRPLNQK